jgi:hypothetical protein
VQTDLLEENNLLEPLPRSCDGEPAPERALPGILPEFKAPRKGDLREPALDGSMGEVFEVEEPDRDKLADGR